MSALHINMLMTHRHRTVHSEDFVSFYHKRDIITGLKSKADVERHAENSLGLSRNSDCISF